VAGFAGLFRLYTEMDIGSISGVGSLTRTAKHPWVADVQPSIALIHNDFAFMIYEKSAN